MINEKELHYFLSSMILNFMEEAVNINAPLFEKDKYTFIYDNTVEELRIQINVSTTVSLYFKVARIEINGDQLPIVLYKQISVKEYDDGVIEAAKAIDEDPGKIIKTSPERIITKLLSEGFIKWEFQIPIKPGK